MARTNEAQIELKINCTQLTTLDFLTRSNPRVYLLIKDQRTQKWTTTTCSTEVIMGESNPEFFKSLLVDYHFEELQELRFIVVHVNRPTQKDWRQQEFIGQFDYDLGSLMGGQERKVKGKLYNPRNPTKDCGFITISGEEFSRSKKIVRLRLQVNQIEIKGLFRRKPDLYFRMSRSNEDGTYSPVYVSDSIVSEDPPWPEFEIPENTLCNGDEHRALVIEVKNKRRAAQPIIGSCTFSLNELLNGRTKYQLRPPATTKVNSRASLPSLHFTVSIDEPPTFLDYIAGGIEINLVVAIDFTSSNGNHRNPNSLHYSNQNSENSYQKAISSVGKILEAYDYDKKYPVYGFGAKFNGVLSHVHPLNNDYENPEVTGIDGILAAYSQTMNSVELFGPTNFSPIINQTASKIRSELDYGNDKAYYILLIITDGVITDMELTVRAIINASSLPLSIVIVGVGNADFTKMHILDADDVPLTDGDTQMESDIVQFVAMKDFETEYSKYLLPKAVLEEIPEQFLGYMRRKGILPSSPVNNEIIPPEYYN